MHHGDTLCSSPCQYSIRAAFPLLYAPDTCLERVNRLEMYYCSHCREEHIHTSYSVDVLHGRVAYRLPWRPGCRPDYSDYIEPARELLRQVMLEAERRLDERHLHLRRLARVLGEIKKRR